MAALSLAALRSQVESDLRGRVTAPFSYRDRNIFEVAPSGILEIDSSVGGLPRGAMTEICGLPGSGRSSLLVSVLASRTENGEVCALVDARDSFDPQTACAAGVDLRQLLWVRCQNIDQALRATDLLIQSGGFGLVAVDLSDLAPKTVRYVPLNAWFRFRRAVEDTPTVLMILDQEANAKNCASLVLRLDAEAVRWSETVKSADCGTLPFCGKKMDAAAQGYSFARLFEGFSVRTEIIRSRMQSSNGLAPAVAAHG
ncbi:MAG TPA: hypothetical protein VGI16_12705 [Candidatus Acidoferrum sp.]|jgi:hypothetical protein